MRGMRGTHGGQLVDPSEKDYDEEAESEFQNSEEGAFDVEADVEYYDHPSFGLGAGLKGADGRFRYVLFWNLKGGVTERRCRVKPDAYLRLVVPNVLSEVDDQDQDEVLRAFRDFRFIDLSVASAAPPPTLTASMDLDRWDGKTVKVSEDAQPELQWESTVRRPSLEKDAAWDSKARELLDAALASAVFPSVLRAFFMMCTRHEAILANALDWSSTRLMHLMHVLAELLEDDQRRVEYDIETVNKFVDENELNAQDVNGGSRRSGGSRRRSKP